jgi:hypothetical protein
MVRAAFFAGHIRPKGRNRADPAAGDAIMNLRTPFGTKVGVAAICTFINAAVQDKCGRSSC